MALNKTLANTPEFRESVIEAFYTDKTICDIARELNTQWATVKQVFKEEFTQEQRKARKVANYRRSKLGDKNPSFGLYLADHPHWKGGRVVDGNGYIIVSKPDWYTGRRGSKYVFEHSVVMCEALGLTEIPEGWCVHHIDKDRFNNSLSNLALCTVSAHNRIHAMERATAIPKGSREKSRSAKMPSLN